MKLKHISVEIQIVISLIFFISSSISSFSQTNLQKPSKLIFLESGKRNINGFDYINLIIVAFSFKMSSIGNNEINNKIWLKRIKTEFLLLTKYL
jgi:hypothetical protein